MSDLFKDLADNTEEANHELEQDKNVNNNEENNNNQLEWDDFVEDSLPLPPAAKPNLIYLKPIWLKIDDLKISTCSQRRTDGPLFGCNCEINQGDP